MVAPLVALGLRAIAPRALSMLFGTTTRAAVTTVTADQVLNDGRVASSALGAVTDGLTGAFRRSVGLDGPDGQMDWTRLAGMGTAAAIGTMVLDKVLGTPLAMIAALALAYVFRDQIGGLAHSFSRAVGLESGPQTTALATTTPGEVTNPSPEYQQGLAELSRLSRGLSPAPAP